MTKRFKEILLPIRDKVEHIFEENELSKKDVFMIITNLAINFDSNLRNELIKAIEDFEKNT